MMERQRIGQLRDSFDPSCNFVIVKPLTCGGKRFGPGQAFDKALTDERRLRQLYEGRYLKQVIAPDWEQEARPHRPRPVIVLGESAAPPTPEQQVSSSVMDEIDRRLEEAMATARAGLTPDEAQIEKLASDFVDADEQEYAPTHPPRPTKAERIKAARKAKPKSVEPVRRVTRVNLG